MWLALFKIAKVTKHRIDLRKKKKKNDRTDGTREGFDETSLLIVILSRGSCSRPIRHVLPLPAEVYEFCYFPLYKENAVQPMNDWELERGIRFALQRIPDNFARLSDERPLFAILLLVKMFHGNDRICCTFRVPLFKKDRNVDCNNWNPNILKQK